MRYGILINNQLEYAQNRYTTDDGKLIVNFNKNETLMRLYGFKPIVDVIPEYDIESQYVVSSTFEETDECITVNYEIKDIVLSFEEKKEKDKEKCLQLFAETLSDEQALLVPLVFDEWKVGIEYKIGKRLVYDNVLYKVLQNHTSQETWTPNVSTSLYARLLAETIDGSIPEWQQPTGSTEAYMIGDKVTYNGQIYECTSDYNVYAPDVSGWKLVE